MLKYVVNTRKLNKTYVKIPVEKITFVDFASLKDEETGEIIEYDGTNKDKLMVICECTDIDGIINGSFVSTVNTLYLNYDTSDDLYQDKFTFVQDYQITGVNKGNKSFSFYIDKNYQLSANRITSSKNYGTDVEDNKDNVFIYFDEYHYFDIMNNSASDSETEINYREAPIFFRYVNAQGEIVKTQVIFKYYAPDVLVASYDDFGTDEQKNLYELIFKTELDEETEDILEGDLGGIDIYRENFLFGEKTNYEFSFERATVHLSIPIVNTFEANLQQTELLSEHFVEKEKKKAINAITDIEKDVYYPCISNLAKNNFTDVYTIKFNLHFREHRDDEWITENDSLWNGIRQDIEYVKGSDETVKITEEAYNALSEEEKAKYVRRAVEGTAEIAKVTISGSEKALTRDDSSDLLTFLNFTNDDVYYQKNKLKKSFLRLLYFDSMNPGNQNLIGYSVIFFDTGDMFAKYVKYIEEDKCYSVGADRKSFGKYKETGTYKTGIRVDRDIDGDDTIRLGSQFIVRSKSTSKASSEGFYIYIWKDNSSPLPQDLYMKVEFNHAGFGRTVPFMLPYWDKKKWNDTEKGIKTLQQIIDDWNDVKQLQDDGKVVWANGTDGHYGIRQYTKFSYIHLKYQYDKENDRHIYYLDPDTYDTSVTKQDKNEIVINLYEAKVE